MSKRTTKRAMPTYEEIKPAAGDFLVFIDDTGHETFAGNQGFYGLGGCLMTAFSYEHLKPKWREVRKIINADPEAPLHGSDITANSKARKLRRAPRVLRRSFLRPYRGNDNEACGSAGRHASLRPYHG